MVRVVINTNVLLVSISPNAPNHWVIRHFRVLKQVEYPKVEVIGIQEFKKELEGS